MTFHFLWRRCHRHILYCSAKQEKIRRQNMAWDEGFLKAVCPLRLWALIDSNAWWSECDLNPDLLHPRGIGIIRSRRLWALHRAPTKTSKSIDLWPRRGHKSCVWGDPMVLWTRIRACVSACACVCVCVCRAWFHLPGGQKKSWGVMRKYTDMCLQEREEFLLQSWSSQIEAPFREKALIGLNTRRWQETTGWRVMREMQPPAVTHEEELSLWFNHLRFFWSTLAAWSGQDLKKLTKHIVRLVFSLFRYSERLCETVFLQSP